jgi:hypothetical protein
MTPLKYLLTLVLLTTFTATHSQERKQGIEYRYNVDAVLSSRDIVFYGWDFSRFKIFDASKMGDAEEILKTYIPTWIGMLNEEYTTAKLAANFKKNVTPNLASVQSLFKNLNPDEIVTFLNYDFPIDTVKKVVKSYNLPERSGTGLVIILEAYNKSERYVTGYVTFFDIQSREILWSTKMKGLPGSKWGFTKYLFEGFVELYHYFVNDYYYKQLNKKAR